MKKFFAILAIVALASCGGSQEAAAPVDSVAAPVDSVSAPVDSVAAPVDSAAAAAPATN